MLPLKKDMVKSTEDIAGARARAKLKIPLIPLQRLPYHKRERMKSRMQSFIGIELVGMLPCSKSAGMMSSTEVPPELISHLERAEVEIESMIRLSESPQLFKRSN